MKAPSWFPFQKQELRGQDTRGIPAVYIRANGVDAYDPYKQKAIKFGIFMGIAITVGEVPAFLSVNPYTHQPDPAWSALGIFFAIATLLMGLFYLRIEQYFHSEASHKYQLFGAFTLRVRKWFKCKFVSPVGTIERIPDELAKNLRAVLDGKFEQMKTDATLANLKDKVRDPSKLNTFYMPLPENELPDCVLLSPAPEPSYLHNGSPAEIIWDKNIRRVPKLEDFDFAVLGEYRFEIEGVPEIQVVPICYPAGTFFDFTDSSERALMPATINAGVVNQAIQNTDAKLLGYEATQLVVLLKRQIETNRKIDDKNTEFSSDMAGKILELEEAIARKQDRVPEKKPSKMGSVIGYAIIAGGLILTVALAWKWFF